jgi:Uma2 family endonuclease
MLERKVIEYRYTYGDYVQWEGDERWELIDGVPFDMSPAPNTEHQRIVFELGRQIGNFLVGKPCRAFVAPFDVRLPERDEADDQVRTVVQPDVAVFCDASKLDKQGARGAPNWVVEVLSPRTSVRDQVQKRDLYARHGVSEYWIIDPTACRLQIFLLDPETRRYETPRVGPAEGKTLVRRFASSDPTLEIDWSTVFA